MCVTVAIFPFYKVLRLCALLLRYNIEKIAVVQNYLRKYVRKFFVKLSI